jgi:hypothetical protein
MTFHAALTVFEILANVHQTKPPLKDDPVRFGKGMGAEE